MQESSTYHWLKARDARIRAEGEARRFREMVLFTGRKKLGEPPAFFVDSLQKMDDHDRLRALADQVFEASPWDEIVIEE